MVLSKLGLAYDLNNSRSRHLRLSVKGGPEIGWGRKNGLEIGYGSLSQLIKSVSKSKEALDILLRIFESASIPRQQKHTDIASGERTESNYFRCIDRFSQSER